MKHYIGKGTTSKYDAISCSICLDDLNGLIATANNGKKYINFTVTPMKNPDKYGKTHTIFVWTDDGENEPKKAPENDNKNSDDFPF